jgi:hypothetical protein
MHRRDFLGVGLSGVVGSLLPNATSPVVPRVNGGVNIQPVRRLDTGAGLTPPLIVPELVDAQMAALYELGFAQIRLTLSFDRFGPDFLAAIPYVRAARALGIDVLGIIGQFTGFDLVQALSKPATREEVLEVYLQIFVTPVPAASPSIGAAGRFSAQVLNEPTAFLGIPPDVYVRDYLRPAYYHLKEDDPSLDVVSAAAIGSAEGIARTRIMIETGLESYCDRVAFHVYNTRFLRELRGLTNRISWVTESGAGRTDLHLEWMTTTFDRIRNEIPTVERIYWFELFDLDPGKFRLLDIHRRDDGEIETIRESAAALDYLDRRVADALGSSTPLSYRELVPDIMLYFPTDEDSRIIRSTSFGSVWGP